MCIEGGSADIGGIDNLLHRNLIVILFRQKRGKGTENGLSCFLLPSIHAVLPNKSPKMFRIEQGQKSDS
jgi:hypothetical protein